MKRPGCRIEPARTAAELAIVGGLLRQYAASLEVDLRFQDFDHEVATLPGRYAPPGGMLLLARDADDTPLGCVGLRPLAAPHLCEMKRLYLVDAARGRGVGRALVDAVVDAARAGGYRALHLDTLPTMHAAADLYERAGFVRAAPHYATPVPGTLFFVKTL